MSTEPAQASRDAVREELIAYCGQRLIKAQEAGDKGLAYFWLEAQNTQIRLRSPEQVARMEAEKGIA